MIFHPQSAEETVGEIRRTTEATEWGRERGGDSVRARHVRTNGVLSQATGILVRSDIYNNDLSCLCQFWSSGSRRSYWADNTHPLHDDPVGRWVETEDTVSLPSRHPSKVGRRWLWCKTQHGSAGSIRVGGWGHQLGEQCVLGLLWFVFLLNFSLNNKLETVNLLNKIPFY